MTDSWQSDLCCTSTWHVASGQTHCSAGGVTMSTLPINR